MLAIRHNTPDDVAPERAGKGLREMGSLYHYDDDDDLLGPSLEEMAASRARIKAQNEAERIAHTYNMQIGDVAFSLHLPWNSPKNGVLWFDMEANMLPDAVIPSDISRQSISEMLFNCGYHGHIYSGFIEVQDGVFVASDAWMQLFANHCEKVRKRNIIKIDGEAYHFPITGYGADTKAHVNGQVFPLKRDESLKCWILNS